MESATHREVEADLSNLAVILVDGYLHRDNNLIDAQHPRTGAHNRTEARLLSHRIREDLVKLKESQ